MQETYTRRKGISSVLGALLIVLVTTTAGVGAYVFANNLQGSLELSSGASQTRERLTIENSKLTFDSGASSNNMTLHARNTGPVQFEIAQLYVDGALQTNSTGTWTVSVGGSSTLIVDVGELATIDVDGIEDDSGSMISTEYTQGTAHAVKIVTKAGAIFTGTVIKETS